MYQSAFDPPGTHRPLPVPTALSAPYWEACLDGRLTHQHCGACDAAIFPPEPVCPTCLSLELDWRPSAGTGTVYSFSVLHREPSAHFPLPSVFAIVDLDEGYSVFSSIVECEHDDLAIGMAVEVVFDRVSETIALPLFRPRTQDR